MNTECAADGGTREVGDVHFVFRDLTFRSIHVRHFQFDANMSPETALSALFSDPYYKGDWLDQRADRNGTIHGPYELESVTASAYRNVSPQEAADYLDQFCSLYDAPVTEPMASDITSLIGSRIAKSQPFILEPDGLTLNGIGSAMVMVDFRELVLFDPESSLLTVVVMYSD